jgi:UDP-glucuronate decarboxylase
METARQVVDRDLDSIVRTLEPDFKQMAGRRLLVAGGAGFLGYYLVQAALRWNDGAAAGDGIDVTVWDSFVRGVPDWLEDLDGRPDLALVQRDVTAPPEDGDGPFHYLIHAASIASPTFYRTYPIETMDANVGGLRRLLDRAVAQRDTADPAEGMLFFSSSEIYGDPDPAHIPTAEDYRGNVSCTGPRACYDESKRYGETLCVNFAAVHGVPVRVARPFNNYGPGLKVSDRRVIPDFARDVLAGRDIVMLSDGSPSRTFCYAADAIVGYYRILVRGRNGEAYNVGTEEPEVTMADLAERIAALARELYGYTGSVVRAASADVDYLVDNPYRRRPDITKARQELDYRPEVDLDDGLRRSMTWYGDHRVASDA